MVEKRRNNASGLMFLCMVLSIACLISGVMLCGSLVAYAEKSSIPVASMSIVSPINEMEVDEEIYTIVRNRYNLVPSFRVEDADKVWVDRNEVNIFKFAYDNELGEVTVVGNGSKVIAPGTMNSYYFELINDGEVPVEYAVSMEAYFSNENYKIPVEAKLSDYTGRYIVGSETSWEGVLEVNRVSESGELSEGNKMRYVFSWQWPFESGNDEYDTMLGNLAVDEDLTLTVVINTIAQADENAGGGFATGDDANIGILMASTIGSLGLIVILITALKKEKEAEEDEA